MTALNRKLLRDLWNMRTQSLAICLVMASGVATVVLSLSTLRSLEYAQATYYERYHFANIFAHLKRAPNSLAAQIAEIPGAANVQTRVATDVTLDVPGLIEPAGARLVSIPDEAAEHLNSLYLRAGRLVAADHVHEALVSEAFAKAHALAPGDSVIAIINGRRERLTIVGVALSPEYIYSIRPGELFPDNKRFGVFWMNRRELAAALDLEDAFNDVAIELALGTSKAEAISRLDALIAPYGGIGAYGRDEQLSNRFVTNELRQLRGMATLPPAIFLTVSAFLLQVVLSRLIATQRDQIGTIKAFGYTRREVAWHFLKFVLILVFVGDLVGVTLGAWLGNGLTEIYTEFFRFPVLDYRLEFSVVAAAVVVSLVASAAGALGAVRRAVRLAPAQAMQPEPPQNFRATFFDSAAFRKVFGPATQMILRNLWRQPLRTALSCLGIAAAIGLLVLGNCAVDSINYVIDFEFFNVERFDMMLTFSDTLTSRVRSEVEHLPGVVRAEPFRAVPVRICFEKRSRRISMIGLDPAVRLRQLLDRREKRVALPAEGIVISAKLAEILGCRIGNTLSVEVMEGNRPVHEVVVAGMIDDFTEPVAYMDIDALHRTLREADCFTGALLMIDADHYDELCAALKNTPRVSGVGIKQAALASFQSTFAENILRMKAINALFAAMIACGVVYNSARISLEERSRDLAMLRVLGYTRAEISYILLAELAIVTLVAIPIGLPIGYGFGAILMQALNTETQRFPLVVSTNTFGMAVLVVLAAAILSGLVVRRRLDQLDLVAVLKARE